MLIFLGLVVAIILIDMAREQHTRQLAFFLENNRTGSGDIGNALKRKAMAWVWYERIILVVVFIIAGILYK